MPQTTTYTIWNDTHGWPCGTFTGWADQPGAVGQAQTRAREEARTLRREWPDQKFTVTSTTR